MAFLPELAHRSEDISALDTLAEPVAGVEGGAVRLRGVRNLLSGTNLGHPLHPMLTDLPIGAWSMSPLLDSAGGATAQSAADLLVGVGILAAIPTAMSGLNDWSDHGGRASAPSACGRGLDLAGLADMSPVCR
jgi:hypothetical protein